MDNNSSSSFNELKSKINIVDVIGKYLTLVKKGRNFWVVCPFHEDSNPSMSISLDKQIYKCFSCNEQGDVFIFLQKFKHLTFKEAVKEAAAIANVDLAQMGFNLREKPVDLKAKSFYEILKSASDFFEYQWSTAGAKNAKSYLNNRDITDADIKFFNIGYAPGNNELTNFLKAKGFNNVDIVNAGLAKISHKDELIDYFIDRIMFPIADRDGNVVGFSGREYLGKKDIAKYVNSPETYIFKKHLLFYNLHQALNRVTRDKNIYLVEGYADVIALKKANKENAIALMGTALSKEQVEILKQINAKILIFLDGDDPGKVACLKASKALLQGGINVLIVNNPFKLDPDDIIRTKSPEQVQKILADEIHPLQFAIDFYQTKYQINNKSADLKLFLENICDLYYYIGNEIEKKYYLKILMKLTEFDEHELLSMFANLRAYRPETMRQRAAPISKEVSNTKLDEAQQQLIFLMMSYKAAYESSEKSNFIFPSSDYLNIFFFIKQVYDRHPEIVDIDLNKFVRLLQDENLVNLIAMIVEKYKNQFRSYDPHVISEYINLIKNEEIEEKIRVIKKEISVAPDENTAISLLKRIAVLKNKKASY